MIIQVGEIQMDKVTQQKIIYNKTRKFLLPCLKEYGSEFLTKFNSVYKFAAGIGDVIVTQERSKKPEFERHIFILLDSTIATSFFIEFIDWVKDEHYYVDDYVFGNIQKSNYHMVILRFPEKYYDSFTTFQEGKYSKMFNSETIEKFFHNYPDVKKIFIKDYNYRIVFTKRLNRLYGSTLKPEEYDGELELPPTDETELFNHHLKK